MNYFMTASEFTLQKNKCLNHFCFQEIEAICKLVRNKIAATCEPPTAKMMKMYSSVKEFQFLIFSDFALHISVGGGRTTNY